MLVLTRRIGEKIIINDDITIKILDVHRDSSVKIGIDAPHEVTVHREEIYKKIKEQESKVENETL